MTRFMGENQPGELRLFNIKKEGEQSNYIYIYMYIYINCWNFNVFGILFPKN